MFIQVFNNSKYLGSVTGLDKLKEKTQRIEDYEWKISFSVSHIKYKKCIFGMVIRVQGPVQKYTSVVVYKKHSFLKPEIITVLSGESSGSSRCHMK